MSMRTRPFARHEPPKRPLDRAALEGLEEGDQQ